MLKDKIKFDVYQYENNMFDDLYNEIVSVIDDGDDLSDFEDTLEQSPTNIYLAFSEGVFVGVSWYTVPIENESIVGVWVSEKYRNKGCATELINRIDCAINNIDVEGVTAYAFSDGGKKSSALLSASGFAYSHSYVTMSYFGKSCDLNVSNIKIEHYSDEYYEQMVELRNNGIKEVGRFYGEDSKDIFFVDDKEYRNYMNKRSNDSFVIVNNGVLEGFIMVRGSEIMALNVRPEKRGNKYAIALVDMAIKHLKKNNCENIELICVDKNEPAYKLYKKLGFESVGWVSCYKKEYMR